MNNANKISLFIAGQFMSQIGSAITGFAFGIFIFKIDKHVTDLALLYFFQILPAFLLPLPLGSLVDMFSKKKIIILADIITILGLLFLMLKACNHNLNHVDLYGYVIVCSIFSTLQGIAITAFVGSAVTSEERVKFNALLTLKQSIPRMIGPLFAGLFASQFNITMLIFVDIVCTLFAIGMTYWISEPTQINKVSASWGGILNYKSTWRYLVCKPQLLWSSSCLMLSIITVSMMGVYIIPLALHESTTTTAGKIIAMGGLGSIFSGLLVSYFRLNNLKIDSFIPISLALQGGIVFFGSLLHSVIIMGAVLFLYFFINPFQRGCSYALWQNSTEELCYGKIFAIKSVLLQSAGLITFMFCGPLADKVLDPLMRHYGHHGIHLILSSVYGVGKDRGMDVALGLAGLAQCCFGMWIYLRRKLVFKVS